MRHSKGKQGLALFEAAVSQSVTLADDEVDSMTLGCYVVAGG